MITDGVLDASQGQRKDSIASIAGYLSVLSTGEHALLRRMYPNTKPAADGVVVKLLLYAGIKPHEYLAEYEIWRLLVHVAALLSGTGKTNPHDPRRSLGAALEKAGFSENRLMRLTASRGEPLERQVAMVGRMLARSGGGPVNLRTIFDLTGKHAGKAEEARLAIAQTYYRDAAPHEGDRK